MPFDETSSSHIFTSGGKLTGTLICTPVDGTAICFGEERADVPALRRFFDTLDVIAGDESIFQPIRARAFRFAGGPVPPPTVGEGIIAFIGAVLQVSNDGAPYIPLSAGIGGNLDDAYHFGPPGTGRTINADEGAVIIIATIDPGPALSVIGTALHGGAPGTGRGSVFSPGTGANSERYGFGAQAFAGSSVSLGRDALAGTNPAHSQVTAVGAFAVANGGNFSTAIGGSSSASNANSTAVGAFALAGEDSVAIGAQATAVGGLPFSAKVAIGWLSQANAFDCTAVGGGALSGTLLGLGSVENVAIGVNARSGAIFAGGSQSVCVGKNSQTTGLACNAVGFGSRAGNLLGTTFAANAFGQIAIADATGSLAIGHNATSTGQDGIAIGSLASCGALASICIGDLAVTTGLDSIAMGITAKGRGNFGIAIGAFACQNAGDPGFVNGAIFIGHNAGNAAVTHSSNAIGIGDGAGSLGQASLNSVAIGSSSQVLFPAGAGIAIGLSALVSTAANPGIAIGSVSFSSGVNSICLGVLTTGSGAEGVSIGRGANVAAAEGIAIGGDDAAVSASVLAGAVAAIALGAGSVVGGTDGIAIGRRAVVIGPIRGIAIGRGAAVTTANTVVWGDGAFPLNAMFLGAGQTATPGPVPLGAAAFTLKATSAVTAGNTGQTLIIQSGDGAALADAGGSILFGVKLAGTAGSGTRIQISPVARAVDETAILVDVQGTGLQRVSRGALNSGGAGFRTLRVPN